MTNTKDLRAEVEAFGEDMVDVEVGTEIELKKFAIQCATDPDSPLLKKALELLDDAIDRIHSEGANATDLVLELAKIRACQEAYK